MFTSEQTERFWNHVDQQPNRCWEWTGCLDRYGYGKVKIGGVVFISHRIAYEISKGEFDKSMHILHSCDNPKCCNPEHLHLGTHVQNMREMAERGRAGNRYIQRRRVEEF